MDTKNYTMSQLMVAAAAREVSDNETVFVGMRLPLLGFLLAKSTHAPNAVGVYELGIVRDTVAPAPILTMGDLPNIYRSQWLGDTADTMGLLQQGLVDVSFIGGAQIDKFGNLNTNYIYKKDVILNTDDVILNTDDVILNKVKNPEYKKIETRLPGSGGACDLASLAKRHIIIMAHEKHRFVSRVDYITSPGYGEGYDWRNKVGLPRGGPSAVITTLGIFRFTADTHEMILDSLHPGINVEQVIENTGWNIKISQNMKQTPVPTETELSMLKRFDPEGYWTGK